MSGPKRYYGDCVPCRTHYWSVHPLRVCRRCRCPLTVSLSARGWSAIERVGPEPRCEMSDETKRAIGEATRARWASRRALAARGE